MDNKWIKVEAGVYELERDRSIFIIHWSKMHPEPPEYPEDTWELYQHEGGDNNLWDSGRTLTELKSFGERVQRENFAKAYRPHYTTPGFKSVGTGHGMHKSDREGK